MFDSIHAFTAPTPRARGLRLLLPAALPALLAHCTLADLRDDGLRRGVTSEARTRGLELMRAAGAAHGVQPDSAAAGVSPLAEVWGRDVWYSSLTRRFTPLERDSQSFHMRLERDGDRFEFTDGENKGYVLGRKGARFYRMAANAKNKTPVFESDSGAFIYLESLRLYLELTFLAPGLTNLAYMGRETIQGRAYDLVFASPGGFEPGKQYDQYVFALDAETHRIAYVRFTYRKVFSFYKGVLRYEDYRKQGDFIMPHKIAVLDAPRDTEPVHEIIVERIKTRATSLFRHVRSRTYTNVLVQ